MLLLERFSINRNAKMFIKYYKLTVLILLLFCMGVHGYIYDYYSTHVVSPDQVLRTANIPNFRECTTKIEECSPVEPRRVGDACNNMKRPSEAANRNQYSRLLPPRFETNNSIPHFAEDGSKLPLARAVRTTLQKSARVVSNRFSMLSLHYGGFLALDFTRIDAVVNYVIVKTDCCKVNADQDPKCIPIYVPKNDPYLKETGIRCMNLTRALSFQEVQCVSNDVPFSVVNFATPLLDLQQVYGANLTVADAVRTGVDGLLAMEYRNKRYVPPGKASTCFANKPGEPCYEVGDTGTNFQPKLALVELWFFRLHNAIASKLSLINSCWDDEHLYRTARQITIAIHQKISFYELLPGFLGYENMLKEGLITKGDGYVNSYNPHLDTRTSAEVAVAYRVLHSLLDDSFGLYDKDAKLVGVTALNFYLFGSGVLENNDNMETMSRSMFYQPAGDSRRHADTALSNNMYRAFHKANDLFTIDIMRGRDFGLRSYNKYRKYCGLPKAHHFEDLKDTMDSEAILKLKKLYHSVDAIELVPGLIAERELPGTAVGSVFWCILGDQFARLKNADRFWFENGKVKTKLTKDQLAAVKEYTMSRLVCDHADGVYKVQPNPFLVVSKENPLVKCDSYPELDLTLWRDSFCDMAPNGRIN